MEVWLAGERRHALCRESHRWSLQSSGMSNAREKLSCLVAGLVATIVYCGKTLSRVLVEWSGRGKQTFPHPHCVRKMVPLFLTVHLCLRLPRNHSCCCFPVSNSITVKPKKKKKNLARECNLIGHQYVGHQSLALG